MMKHFLFLIAFFCMMSSARAEEVVFAHGFEDLPNMPELKQVDDHQMKFDTPSGRIIEAVLTGEQSNPKLVKEFYMNSLPQLGWTIKKKGTYNFSFTRDDEELRFTVEKSTPILVKIELLTIAK